MRRALATVLAVLVPAVVIAAATGISTQQTRTAAPSAVNLSGVAAAEGSSLAHARADHTHSLTGVLALANGGTGLSAAADDTVPVSNGTAWEAKAVPSCTAAGCAIQYNAGTNAWGANTAIDAATGDNAAGFFPAGALEVARGGTGAAPGADDQVLVSDSTVGATWRGLTNCSASGSAVSYATASNAWGCNSAIQAATGDAATGFFASGAIEAARGGTGIDTSGSTGAARVSAGTWSIGTLAVAHGGTGSTSFGAAAGALVVSGASGTGAMGRVDAVATGQVLTSAGTATNPAWSATPSVTSIAVTGTGSDTVGTLGTENLVQASGYVDGQATDCSVTHGFNVTTGLGNCARTAAGRYTVTYTTALASTAYVCTCSPRSGTGVDDTCYVSAHGTTSITFDLLRAGVLSDGLDWMFICVGP